MHIHTRTCTSVDTVHKCTPMHARAYPCTVSWIWYLSRIVRVKIHRTALNLCDAAESKAAFFEKSGHVETTS